MSSSFVLDPSYNTQHLSGNIYANQIFAYPGTGGFSTTQTFETIQRLPETQINIFDTTGSVQVVLPVGIFNAKLGLFKTARSALGGFLYDATDSCGNYYDNANNVLTTDTITLTANEFTLNLPSAASIISVGKLSTIYTDFANYVAAYFNLANPASNSTGFATLFQQDYHFNPNGGVFDASALYQVIKGNGIMDATNHSGITTLGGSVTVSNITKLLRYAVDTNAFGNRDPSNGITAIDPSNAANYGVSDGFLAGDVIFVPNNGFALQMNVNINYGATMNNYIQNNPNQQPVISYVDTSLNNLAGFHTTSTNTTSYIGRQMSTPLLIRLVDTAVAVAQSMPTQDITAGSSTINLVSYTGLTLGMTIVVGSGATAETRTIVGFGSVVLDRPLSNSHPAATTVVTAYHPIQLLDASGVLADVSGQNVTLHFQGSYTGVHIYRGSTKLNTSGLVTGNSYVDTSSPTGTNTYSIVPVDTHGNVGKAHTVQAIIGDVNNVLQTGCICWVDANDTNCYTFSSGTNVATIKDKSILAFTGNKVGPTYPTIVTNAINTQSAFYLDNGGFLATLGTTYTGDVFSAYFVFKSTQNQTTYSRFISFGNYLGEDDTRSQASFACMGFVGNENTITLNRNERNTYERIPLDPNTCYIASCLMDGTNAKFYLNGTNMSTRTNFEAGNFNIQNFGLGCIVINGSYGQLPKGYYISEVLGYTTYSTTIQRQQIEGYLATKYGLRGNLPSNHPYSMSGIAFTDNFHVTSTVTTTTIPDGLYYFKCENITGNTMTNYGTVGGNGTITNQGGITTSISTTVSPPTTSSSSLFISYPPPGNYNGNGSYITLPNYTWTNGSGFTMSFWYNVGGMSVTNQQNLAYVFPNRIGNNSNINFTHPGNIGYGSQFIYNGITYDGWQAVSLYFNTYNNGGTTGANSTWFIAKVPFMKSNTWNHIALTITGTFTNPVYTFYFNGTPYILGSSVFSRTNGSNSIGYPADCLSGNVSFCLNMPGYMKNVYVNNVALTANQITDLMNAN
jgi:hypothetical protein